MNLYLITQPESEIEAREYYDDWYISAVVVAESEEVARSIYPGGQVWLDGEPVDWTQVPIDPIDRDEWCPKEKVLVKLLGTAEAGLVSGSVVCYSFHCGD